MNNAELQKAVRFIKKSGNYSARCAIILGSGLGDFADTLENKVKIPTSGIPGYPKSTVEGHSGYLVFGKHKNIPLMAIQGRTHYYEGYTMREVTFVIRIVQALGIKLLMVTNAAGGINPDFVPGDLMLITDHVNFLFDNPLRGPMDFGGSRFPDMSDPYSSKYHDRIEQIARNRGISLKKGVLWASTGPSYETKAEVEMIRKYGGDAGSMSTAPEVIAAVQAGLEVIGISCITNYATGSSSKKLSHSEVTETAQNVKKQFVDLISGILTELIQNI